MKCFLVTAGSYSDYEIHAVYTNREAAEAYRHFHDLDQVEEFELNPELESIEYSGDAYVVYATITPDGFLENVRTSRVSNKTTPTKNEVCDYTDLDGSRRIKVERCVFADSEEHALKIFRDVIRPFMAGQEILICRYKYDASGKTHTDRHREGGLVRWTPQGLQYA